MLAFGVVGFLQQKDLLLNALILKSRGQKCREHQDAVMEVAISTHAQLQHQHPNHILYNLHRLRVPIQPGRDDHNQNPQPPTDFSAMFKRRRQNAQAPLPQRISAWPKTSMSSRGAPASASGFTPARSSAQPQTPISSTTALLTPQKAQAQPFEEGSCFRFSCFLSVGQALYHFNTLERLLTYINNLATGTRYATTIHLTTSRVGHIAGSLSSYYLLFSALTSAALLGSALAHLFCAQQNSTAKAAAQV